MTFGRPILGALTTQVTHCAKWRARTGNLVRDSIFTGGLTTLVTLSCFVIAYHGTASYGYN